MAQRCDYPSQIEQHWRVAGKFGASRDLLRQFKHDDPKISFFQRRSKEVEHRAHSGSGVLFLETRIPQDLDGYLLKRRVVCGPARCRGIRKR
jgi:hypothetical protein